MPAELQELADTAFLSAYYRYRESLRDQPLFIDRDAALLAGQKGSAISAYIATDSTTFLWVNAVRTHCVDTLLLQTLRKGPISTVVNLGCGFDTRQYRLDLPSTLRWVDLDMPQIIEHKRSILKNRTANCRIESIGVDLGNADERRAIFDRLSGGDTSVLVLSEGCLPFLSNDDIGSLATDLASCTPVTEWLMDIYSPLSLRVVGQSVQQRLKEGDGDLKFAPKLGSAFFSPWGWTEERSVSVVGQARALGRVPFPSSLWLPFAYCVPSLRRAIEDMYRVVVLKKTSAKR
jgi:methyltransferase (TIGR00027 family)